MFDRILFPTDGSEGADAALDLAADLATDHDATLYVLNVADTTRDSVIQVQGEVVDSLEAEGERIVAEAADRLRTAGVDVETEVLQGEPYRTIVDFANARDVDVVVMPTRGRTGLERLLLGSTTERVLRQSDVPVLTVRPDDAIVRYPFADVLLPTDGSDCAREALDVACDLSAAGDADLHLLSVVNVASLGADVRSEFQVEALERNASSVLETASTAAGDRGGEPAASVIEIGASVHKAILAYVEEHGVDLIVVGTHGRTGFDRYLLGSVTESLVRTAPVPVLTVREPST